MPDELATSSPSEREHPPRVLVIEDNEANLELMRYLLDAHGYDVVTATDGAAGLELARTEGERISLILCDVQLPGMDGFELARLLKAGSEPRPPILAVSALAMVGDRDAILSAGFDGYIAKPLDPRSFVARIEAYLPVHRRSGKTPGGAQREEKSLAVRRLDRHLTVLVVDDVGANAEVLRSTLEPSGYAVVSADSGERAIELLQDFLPDLILSDLHMKGEQDFDLIRRVKADARLAAVPFVIISSTSKKQALAEEGRRLGAMRFLFRPIDPSALLSEVEQCFQDAGGNR